MASASGRILWLLGAVVFAGEVSVAADASPSVRLAEDGRTRYRIIIPHEADAAEEFAAKELGEFLGEMTGARFPIRGDDAPPREHEIALGRTNRYDTERAAAHLRPTTPEGFLIDRQGPRLIITGAIPRATLYGVYDFLEVELGCRFLAPGVNHVPHRPTVHVAITPRRYDPPLEYRNIYAEARWAVRNRLNATWGWVPMEEELGGVRFVGPSFVHTFGYLVPSDTYFDEHPEYYALVDGKRHRTVGGGRGQLCLTHPDVLRISTEAARGWIREYEDNPRHNPHSRLVVSISANDNSLVCECPDCAAVNEEEQSRGGTLMRFVNAVAEALEEEFPTVRVETLAYGPSLQPPAITRPRDNVIIRFAPIGADFGRPLNSPAAELNRPTYESITRWSDMGAHIYVWHYTVNFHAYFKPFPNLRVLDHDVRFLRAQGMTGLYAQGSQTPGSDLRPIRDYLLAKLMWRPETDARATIEEFCRLYYGAGATGVLQYVDLVHDYLEAQGEPLRWNDASRADGIVYDDEFLAAADAILKRAEADAESEEEKLRVAEVRLSVWHLVLRRAFAAAGRGEPVSQGAWEAGRRWLEVSRAVGVTHMSEFYGPAREQLEKEFYPKIEALLRRQPGGRAAPPPGVLRQSAAFLSNSHRTYTVVADDEALEGSCAMQTADRSWTLGQAIRWGITEPLRASAETGPQYRLRARIKVVTSGTEGLAFRFGYARQHVDWSASICDEILVRADAVEPGAWQWYEIPEPVRHEAADRGQFAFVWPADNPDNVAGVYVDAFELAPVQ